MEKIEKKLNIHYKNALNALVTLKEAHKNISETEELARYAKKDTVKIYRIFRDSLIHRFELAFNTTWLHLEEFLKSEGLVIEISTPKAIFRHCLEVNILTETETRQAIRMVDHRNLTTHGYDEELIEKIANHIPQYIKLLDQMLKRAHSD